MEHTCKLSGVCAKNVTFEITDGRIHNIRFLGGCSGNTQGVAALAEGADVHQLMQRLQGIRCGEKQTSCPDQLAGAIAKALRSKGE